MQNTTAGRHLIITGLCSPNARDRLNDPEYLAKLLHDSIELVGMEVLLPAQVIRVELDKEKLENDEDDGGVTGFAVLSTSHVAIHTWPLRDRVSFDLYSCHDFEPSKVADFICPRLEIIAGDVVNITRPFYPAEESDLQFRFRNL